MSIKEMAIKAKAASLELLGLDEDQRVAALKAIAKNILLKEDEILAANAVDLKRAREQNLSSSLIDRLQLTSQSLKALSKSCLEIAAFPQVVGEIAERKTRPNGLVIEKQRIPIGVIGMIFESRPNVIVDGVALAIKSGNAIILKGGKEAIESNKKIFEVTKEAVQNILPFSSLHLIESREDVMEMLKLGKYIDLVVPRGGSDLIAFVKKHATMPVVAHDKGLCHMYIHADAKSPIPIILNAKVQRTGVCNALESLLLNEDYPENSKIIEALLEAGVEIRGDEKSHKLNSKISLATEKDFQTEYLDKIISLKIVSDLDEAIEHIKLHTSHHTEAIIAQDEMVIKKFIQSLDSSAIIVNATTRFNDGGELGLGAELGISTSKLHAYGPMGAKEMTTTRFIVRGNGQIR